MKIARTIGLSNRKIESAYREKEEAVSITGPSDIGPAELEVRVSKLRTMEFNHYGQYSFLLGVGSALIFTVIAWVGGLDSLTGLWEQTVGLFFFCSWGIVFGIKGLRLVPRGLATNRLTCVVGLVLNGMQLIALTILNFIK
jgi:hypothetical protein